MEPLRTTLDRLRELPENGVFVFGSNAAGHHYAGAARLAWRKFGAKWGQGAGPSGRSYAIPTMDGVARLECAAQGFLEYATDHPAHEFYLTKVGCGIAGLQESQTAPMFADSPTNVIKPEGWSDECHRL